MPRQILTDNEYFAGSSRYALKIKELGTAVDGLFLTEGTDTGHGPQIKLFETLEEAQEFATNAMNDSVEIIEYVYSND